MQTLSALDVLLSNSHCNCFVSIYPHKDQELDYICYGLLGIHEGVP